MDIIYKIRIVVSKKLNKEYIIARLFSSLTTVRALQRFLDSDTLLYYS